MSLRLLLDILRFSIASERSMQLYIMVLLMEETLHHLWCMKPYPKQDILHVNWWSPDFWTIISGLPESSAPNSPQKWLKTGETQHTQLKLLGLKILIFVSAHGTPMSLLGERWANHASKKLPLPSKNSCPRKPHNPWERQKGRRQMLKFWTKHHAWPKDTKLHKP